MATIIDGKAVSAAVKERVKNQIEELKEKNGVQAGLAVVLVGEDPASKVYVRNKKLAKILYNGLNKSKIITPYTRDVFIEAVITREYMNFL